MIGYYVHHHGVGHMTRSASIAGALEEPVTVLSSRRPPADHPAVDWLDLPLDVPADPLGPRLVDTISDPTAHDTLHWAPTSVDGLTDRMAAVAAWIARARPLTARPAASIPGCPMCFRVRGRGGGVAARGYCRERPGRRATRA